MNKLSEVSKTDHLVDAAILKTAAMEDILHPGGKYHFVCHDKDGIEKWADTIDNVVATVGRNLMLDTLLAGSAYTVTGPYLGLISAVSYGAGPVAADTMLSHSGWTEAGNANAPTYTSPRKTAAFNAASGGTKALTAPLTFAITSGTNVVIKGAFLVLGSGAVSTIDNTSGVLYSAGTFTGGDKTVSNGDTLTVSYQTSLT